MGIVCSRKPTMKGMIKMKDESNSSSNPQEDTTSDTQQSTPTTASTKTKNRRQSPQQQKKKSTTSNNTRKEDDTTVTSSSTLPQAKKPRRPDAMIPKSPTQRSSNYNLVSDTAAINIRHFSNGRLAGITNLGNTCFMNSSLQCLAATIPLTDYFLGYEYQLDLNTNNPLGTGGKLAVQYAELMKAMWLGTSSVVKPSRFKSQLEQFAPQFRGYRQHDSQELLGFLLDGIHEDLNRIEKKPSIEDRDCDGTNDTHDAIEAWKNYLRRDKSPIVDIFQGQLRSELTCLECGNRSVRFEPFMYLSVPITKACKTIQDCLRVYLEEEQLKGVNQWYCGKCKQHSDATKKTDLWILPPILIVHLKRFSCNDYGHLASKNKRHISFPLESLDLRPFVPRVPQESLYDLYAVSNHIGNLGGGHYTAYTKSRFEEQWYECNDAHIKPVDPSLVNKDAGAYVLFYNRTFSPMIRRQSENRPDLWPHQLREYARPPSLRGLSARDISTSSC